MTALATPDPAAEQRVESVGFDPKGILPFGGQRMSLRLNDSSYYYQRDPAWANALVGQTGTRLGDIGCTLASLAMASSNLGVDTDPGALNAALGDANGYTANGWIKWNAVTEVTDGQIGVEFITEASHTAVDACLLDGGYPLVRFMLQGRLQHWAVVVGKEGRSWLIRDPLVQADAPIALASRAPKIRDVRCVRRID